MDPATVATAAALIRLIASLTPEVIAVVKSYSVSNESADDFLKQLQNVNTDKDRVNALLGGDPIS